MTRCFWAFLLPIVAGTVLSTATQSVTSDDLLVFISTFAPGEEGSIHAYQLDLESGQLAQVHQTTGVEHPFFMAVSPDRRFLYSIHAPGQFGGKTHEQVAAYKI